MLKIRAKVRSWIDEEVEAALVEHGVFRTEEVGKLQQPAAALLKQLGARLRRQHLEEDGACTVCEPCIWPCTTLILLTKLEEACY